MIQHGDTIQPTENQKVLVQGGPKDSGKTTFAISAGVSHGPVVSLQFDQGNPSIPPGVDPNLVYVKTYEPAQPTVPTVKRFDKDTKKTVDTGELDFTTDKWTPPSNLGEAMLRDIQEVRDAFVQKRPILLSDGAGGKIEIPLPGTLVLDGLVNLAQGVEDWLLAVNHATEPEDFENRFTIYRKRLKKLTDVFNMVIPLPCTVIAVTWSVKEMIENKSTGRFLPDIGGKLDIQGPGKFDSHLRLYSKQTQGGTRYFVSYRGGDLYPGLGIRSRYDRGEDIDVTVEKGKPLPYDRVFPPRKVGV